MTHVQIYRLLPCLFLKEVWGGTQMLCYVAFV